MPDKREEILREIQQLAEKAHSWSEADTCDKIILRVLRELGGYGYTDYVAQESSNGGVPDYAFLPDSPARWLLEAKRYRQELSHQLATQALNYANAQGVRWVVLTNGRQWWLYDQSIFGTPDNKFRVRVELHHTADMLWFLSVVGKQSMLTGEVERQVRLRLIREELNSQLLDAKSAVVRAMVQKLGARIPGVTAEDVVQYLREMPGLTAQQAEPAVGTEETYSLAELAERARELAMGRRPTAVHFPDRTERVTMWIALKAKAILWLDEQKRLPLPPFPRHEGSARYFYNREPRHERIDMIEPHPVETSLGKLYFEGCEDTKYHLRSLVHLMQKAGMDPAQIRISLSGRVRQKRKRKEEG